MRSPALELISVTKSYPGVTPVIALDDVSLSVDHGELAGIVGPSGSGKSTLLHIIGTLDRPTAGEVHIDGYLTSAMSDRRLAAIRARSLGFVFQQFFLLDGQRALDNVADGLLYTGMPIADRLDRAAGALTRVGLEHRLTHRPNELSGGEKQRVAIARAIVGDPSLVLADEPTGALDSRTSEAIIELLNELHAQGSTILIITHDNGLAARLPRQIHFLDGRIIEDTRTTAGASS